MKSSKVYARYSALLSQQYLAEGQIRSLRTLLNNGSRNTTLTADERQALRDAYEYETANHYRIFSEQEEKGIEFLRKTMFRKDGSPRRDKRSSVFSAIHHGIVDQFQEFYFCGYYDATDYSHASAYYFNCRNYLPVYRCCGALGYFDYVYDRNRGGFEILDTYNAVAEKLAA